MEFWGVEVKAGEPLVVEPEDDMVLHLSQACLAEVNKDKGTEPVHLYAKIGDQKLVIGILSHDKFPQISVDLIFDAEFELSHNWKNGSVHFTGYKALIPSESDDDSDSEDDQPLIPAPAKQEIKIVETNKDVKSDQMLDGGDSDEENSSSDDEESDDEQQAKIKNDEESEDEDESDSEEEDEETPEKATNGKKRAAESSKKTPVAEKKARLVTPEKSGIKTDGQKGGGHTATPYPSKQAGKKAANSDRGKQQTSKSGGTFHCKPCNRSFNSEIALQSHTKAKHQ
ncbi:histone deacetylase HDT1 isoform X1 [Ziziphus jujuba]|uniref:Histone deacetylase HDT1 isoform X1 n=1 Tax=Ziziphus jujuba TaxID=326968 RepID=A0A6P4B8Q3_ZIZJJ|nr:histone deacetylase HDT1 isoform X1 [Ziziphus jujuba]